MQGNRKKLGLYSNSPKSNAVQCNSRTNNKGNKHRHLSLCLTSHPTPSPLFPPCPVRACHPWALQSSSMTPAWRAVRPQLLTVRQTPPEQRWARKTTLVAPLIRQAAAAAPHSSTLFLCLFTPLCPTAQNTESSAKVEGEKGEEGEEKCRSYGKRGGWV